LRLVRDTANFPEVGPEVLQRRVQNRGLRTFDAISRSPYNTAFNLRFVQGFPSLSGGLEPQSQYGNLFARQFQANQRRFSYNERILSNNRLGGQFAQLQRQQSAQYEAGTAERQLDFFRRPIYSQDPSLNVLNYARRGFETGGYVSGPNGGDIIPAFLANGEYVLNRNTVRSLGGQSALDNVQRFANGGSVGNSQTTGNTTIGFGDTTELNQALLTFGAKNDLLIEAMLNFTIRNNELVEALNNFPKTIEMRGSHELNVNVTGAAVLENLMPEVKELVEGEIRSSLRNLLKSTFPDQA